MDALSAIMIYQQVPDCQYTAVNNWSWTIENKDGSSEISAFTVLDGNLDVNAIL